MKQHIHSGIIPHTKKQRTTTNERDMFSTLVCTLSVSVNDKLL